uniref:Protein kinase domain-containing protein n=1 Tax=Tetranychus urticae TaxID=32264 RepID=T1JPU5_TETUR
MHSFVCNHSNYLNSSSQRCSTCGVSGVVKETINNDKSTAENCNQPRISLTSSPSTVVAYEAATELLPTLSSTTTTSRTSIDTVVNTMANKLTTKSTVIKYIYDLPYHVRKSLCDLLDADGKWHRLGGQYMGINDTQLTLISHAILRNGSPTNDLLVRWEQTNGQVRHLFKYLHDMGHKRAMLVLAPHVDPKLKQICLGSQDGDEDDEFDIDLNRNSPVFDRSVDNNGNRIIRKQSSASQRSNGESQLRGIQRININDSNADNTNEEVNTRQYYPAGKSRDSELDEVDKGHQGSSGVSGKGKKRIINHQPTAPAASYSVEQKILNKDRWNDLSAETLSVAAGPANPSPSKHINLPGSKFKDKSISVTPSECSISSGQNFLEGLEIPYKELLISTDDFSKDRIIGRGGFGVVYKGVWKGTEVAIKRLKSCDSMHQAKIELRALNQYRIDNILPLYGISLDGPEACLLYQYMPNGSLEDRLLCKGNTCPLTWDQRASIGEGLAKALNFLHTLRGKPLVHGDVKSANVLLDSQFQCKLGDFGLARQILSSTSKGNYTHLTVTSVHGTCVYLPPEYLRNKMLSPAVDVFSYGIVMLEWPLEDVPMMVKDCVHLKDPRMGLSVGDDHWFGHLIRLGLDCANKMMKKRPGMSQVLEYYNQSKTRERIRRLSAGSANGGSSIISELKTPLELKIYYEMTRETNQQSEDQGQPTRSTINPTIENSTDRLTPSSTRQTVSSLGYNGEFGSGRC